MAPDEETQDIIHLSAAVDEHIEEDQVFNHSVQSEQKTVESHPAHARSDDEMANSNPQMAASVDLNISESPEGKDASIRFNLNVSVEENLTDTQQLCENDDIRYASEFAADLTSENKNSIALRENATDSNEASSESGRSLQQDVSSLENITKTGKLEEDNGGSSVRLDVDGSIEVTAVSTEAVENVSLAGACLTAIAHASPVNENINFSGHADGDMDLEDMDLEETDPKIQTHEAGECVLNYHVERENLHVPVQQSFDLNETIQPVAEAVEVEGPSRDQFLEIDMDKDQDEKRSGLKRSRSSCVDNTPSVRVIYNCLTSESKNKLKEVLKYWAQWHSSVLRSLQETDKRPLESGEETYFPALNMGGSLMNVWMDKPRKHARTDTESTELATPVQEKEKDVPLYDRAGFGALTSQETETLFDRTLDRVGDDSRCFNCGSYSHALRDCHRPRDFAAINNSRKLLAEKRGSMNGSRTASRYYQCSPGGKFDGLKPGVLGSETRQLLGIGELDPPPWLNRMRVLGYPPGYIEDQEEEPSGITIFGTGEDDVGESYIGEDGEIIEGEQKKKSVKKKMLVRFPGLNAPIPDEADIRTWGSPLGYSHSDRSHGRRPLDDDCPPGTCTHEYGHVSPHEHSLSAKRSSSSKSPHLGRSVSESGRSSSKSPYEEPHSSSNRHSPKHSLRQYQSSSRSPYRHESSLNQRSPYGNDHSSHQRSPHRHDSQRSLYRHEPSSNHRSSHHDDYDEYMESRRRVWANTQKTLIHHSSGSKSRHSPSKRR